MNQKTALISVYHKEGIERFAQALVRLGWQILSSGGTAKYLGARGIPVRDVAEIVGDPILGHRVVTLSRQIHAGLLARDCPEDRAELERLGIPWIDLVCVDFYPLKQATEAPDATSESVIEKTDIGGPTIVRSAAKGYRIVICDPTDRQWVLNRLESSDGLGENERRLLAATAEAIVADYCLTSACYHGDTQFDGCVMERFRLLAYGENRDQTPAYWFEALGNNDPLALHRFNILSGDPSYIAMADLDSALMVLCRIAEAFRRNYNGQIPYIAVVCKHGNPCGAAFDWSDPNTALRKTLYGDPLAVMGGELVANFAIDDALGQLLYTVPDDQPIGRPQWGLDLVAAPAISRVTIELLGKREKRRLLANQALASASLPPDKTVKRPVRGGWLQQRAPSFILEDSDALWFGKRLIGQWFDDLLLACAVCWTASSNTVILAKDSMVIGRGIGQQDRVQCVRLCLQLAERTGHDTKGSVFASDAFFPFATGRKTDEECSRAMNEVEALLTHERCGCYTRFAIYEYRTLAKLISHLVRIDTREGPDLLIDAGCIGGVVPADGKNLAEVQKYFADAGLAVAYVPPEHRGFAKH